MPLRRSFIPRSSIPDPHSLNISLNVRSILERLFCLQTNISGRSMVQSSRMATRPTCFSVSLVSSNTSLPSWLSRYVMFYITNAAQLWTLFGTLGRWFDFDWNAFWNRPHCVGRPGILCSGWPQWQYSGDSGFHGCRSEGRLQLSRSSIIDFYPKNFLSLYHLYIDFL